MSHVFLYVSPMSIYIFSTHAYTHHTKLRSPSQDTWPFCKLHCPFYQISLPSLELLPFPLFLLSKETISASETWKHLFPIRWWVDPIRHVNITWPTACFRLLQLDKAVSRKSKTKILLDLGEYNLKGGGMREKTQTSKWCKGNPSPPPTMPSYSLSNDCLPTVFNDEHK